ncbi:MAG: hypothetical protein JWL59_4841 [Chthoniobacteraceae bacterium]|nr:hypothetical protein [Chthoniobacteraceae bacterium]
MREFLDVIVCGFAAVLVLGIIFSITTPPTPVAEPAQPDLQYQLFHFSIKTEAAQGASLHCALTPEVTLGDNASGRRKLTLHYEENQRRWLVDPAQLPKEMKISLIGFSSKTDEEALEVEEYEGKASPPKQLWAVLCTGVPDGMTCNVEAFFVNRANENAGAAPLRLRRIVTPGNPEGSVKSLYPGQTSEFSPKGDTR